MKQTELEPGFLQTFRLYILIRIMFWLVLRALQWLAAMEMLIPLTAFRIGMLLVMDLVILGILTLRQAPQRLGRHFLRAAIIAALVPLMVGNYWWPTNNPLQTPFMIFFFAMMVFIAWQYPFRRVVIYVLGLSIYQAWLVLPLGNASIGGSVGWLAMQAAMLLIAGYMIVYLISIQREQRSALAEAYQRQAAVNIRLRQYTVTLEELTISRERNRLARELHDTLAHSLSAVTLQLEAVRALWDINPMAARNMLARADETARTGLTEARRALQALRATPLQDLGLELALEGLACNAADRCGAQLKLELSPEPARNLSPPVEQSIYRIAQEALENTVRHAGARHLMVRLALDNGAVSLEITDDGQGIRDEKWLLENGSDEHLGIRGMRERAARIGGTLAIRSRPGDGTQVNLTVPCEVVRGDSWDNELVDA